MSVELLIMMLDSKQATMKCITDAWFFSAVADLLVIVTQYPYCLFVHCKHYFLVSIFVPMFLEVL